MEIPVRLNLPDQKDLAPYDQILRDVSVTEIGVLPRPGYTVLYDTETDARVDGIFDWREQELVIVVTGGKVFKLDNSLDATASFLTLESGSGVLLLEDGSRLLLDLPAAVTEVTGAADMEIGTRVKFANYGEYLFMANGSKIQMLSADVSIVANGGHLWSCILNHTASATDEPGVGANTATYWVDEGVGTGTAWALGTRYSSGNADQLEDLDAPLSSHIAVQDNYLLALEDDTERIWFSAVTEPWSFESEWISAEELPDNANCLLSHDGDIWVGGDRSVESFVNDGVTPWIRSSYGPTHHGVLAPYSFIFVPEMNTFTWIDDKRRLVALQGRNVQAINHALDTWLRSVPKVTDAISDYVVIGAVPYLIIQFPTSQQSVWVNLMNGTFAELTASGTTIWDISCITNVPAWDLVVAGHRTTGEILSVDIENSKDNAADIPSLVRSPRIQAITTTVTPRLILHFKKAVDEASAGDSTLSVRWRSDGNDWSDPQTVTLTDRDMTDARKDIYRLGSYRYYRQYEFDLSDLHPYQLIRVEQV